MFLLNCEQAYPIKDINMSFTSHYVPIKSQSEALEKAYEKAFTSHYVPIKSIITLVCQ